MTDGAASLGLVDERRDLRADCSRCQGLCCVAPAFAKSADFAIDKPAGRPCPNLSSDFSCSIHAALRGQGFPGCTVFDCFGAGQQVVQVTFVGQDWRKTPEAAASMFAVFNAVRQLKELQWYLAEGLAALPLGPLRDEVTRAQAQNRRLVDASVPDLEHLDLAAHRAQVGPLLAEISEALRAEIPDRGRDRVGADLIGAKLQGVDLHGISLRWAHLLGADLRDADLTKTDLLGADLRGADLRGALMDGSLFLTQPQVDAAGGDLDTSLPRWLTRPEHWSSTPAPSAKQLRKRPRRQTDTRPL